VRWIVRRKTTLQDQTCMHDLTCCT
jgi:hypothetical protein